MNLERMNAGAHSSAAVEDISVLDDVDTLDNNERVNLGEGEYFDIDKKVLSNLKYLRSLNPDFSGDAATALHQAEKIAGANCHKTALFLTGKIDEDELFHEGNDKLETSGHLIVADSQNTEVIDLPENGTVEASVEALEAVLSEHTLPVRVTFFQNIHQDDGDVLFPKHSVTVFAKTNKNTWHAFEKEDAYGDHPFQNIDLKEVATKFLRTGHLVGVERT